MDVRVIWKKALLCLSYFQTMCEDFAFDDFSSEAYDTPKSKGYFELLEKATTKHETYIKAEREKIKEQWRALSSKKDK